MKSDWSFNCSSWRLRELREALPRCALALSDLVKALEAAEFLAHEEGDVQTESQLARVQTLIHLCQALDISEDKVVRVNVGRRPWQVALGEFHPRVHHRHACNSQGPCAYTS